MFSTITCRVFGGPDTWSDRAEVVRVQSYLLHICEHHAEFDPFLQNGSNFLSFDLFGSRSRD